MKLLTFIAGDREMVGVLSYDEQWVYPISAAGLEYKDMKALIKESGKAEEEALKTLALSSNEKTTEAFKADSVKILAPIKYPDQDIICLGVNYAGHAEESARFKKETFQKDSVKQAVYFSKRVNEAVDPDGGICAHEDMTSQLDYEAELALIIKKDAKNVKPMEVRDYIFGYTIINDVTAREVQTGHKQWYFGKSLDGFTPMGPYIVTADAIEYPPELSICSKVNGELRQNSNTRLFLTNIEEMIVELSRGMTLKAGTIIATGTPAGVGMGFDPPKFLKVGDTVECIIENIGTLRNTVVE